MSEALQKCEEEDYLDELEDLAYERPPLAKDPNTLEQARRLLKEYFGEYERVLRDPTQRLIDLSHDTLAVKLDQLFYPTGLDEITGSLEDEIVELLESPQSYSGRSMLEELADDYPNAVERFRNLYAREPEEPWSPELAAEIAASPPDPYRYIRADSREQIINQYTSESCPLRDSTEFALHAIRGGVNHDEGIEILRELIGQHGWEKILATACTLHLEHAEHEPLFGAIIECVYILSTPQSLQAERVRELFAYAQNDLERIELEAYLHLREKTMSLESVTDMECRELLRDHDGVFWNVERTRDVAAQVMEDIPEVRYGVLRELWDYDYNVDLGASSRDILAQVPSVFAFNAIAQYMPDESDMLGPESRYRSGKGELVRSLMLSPEELHTNTRELLEQNPEAYRRAAHLTEITSKSRLSIALRSSTYDLLSVASGGAALEGREGVDRWGYMINSSALPFAGDTTAVYSPTGRLLGILKTPEKEGEVSASQELADYVSMSHILSDTTHFTAEENATACMLIFWDRLPQRWKDHVEKVFRSCDIDIREWVQASPSGFEQTASFSSELVPVVRSMQGFADALRTYVHDEIKRLTSELQHPERIDDNELTILMNIEFGGGNLSEDEVAQTVRGSSLAAMRFLQETFGVDFSELSRREVFGLLRYLRECQGGQGLKHMQNVAHSGATENARRNRIRAFLSLESGEGMGEAILTIAEKAPPELADQIFATYSAMLDETHDVRNFLCQQYGCQQEGVGKRVRKIADDVRRDGSTLLATYARELAGTAPESVDRGVFERLQAKLATYCADSHLLASSFRYMKEEYPDLTLDELVGTKPRIMAGSELAETFVTQVRAITDANYAQYPDAFRTLMHEKIAERRSEHTRWYATMRERPGAPDEVLSCMSFTDQPDGSVYFANNNTNPWLQGKRLGGTLMYSAVPQEARSSDGDERIVYAHCNPLESITEAYLNKLHFVATKSEIVAGVPSFAIMLDNQLNERLTSTTMTLEEARRYAQGEGVSRQVRVVRVQMNDPVSVSEGQLVTHVFVDPEVNERIVVYETDPRASSVGATTSVPA